MNRFIVIIRQPLERIPPIINLIDCLIEKGYLVDLICLESHVDLIRKYEDRVCVEIIKIRKIKIFVFNKLFAWLLFRKKVLNILEKKRNIYKEFYLWIGSADAAIPLMIWNGLKKYDYIFQCHELYDSFPFYIKRLKTIMNNAMINVGPESNRNAIYRSWFGLKETPITLPNKPYYHPQTKKMPINDKTAYEEIEKIRTKKIILYQGGIVKERDVTKIAQAIENISDEWVLVLMGNTDSSSYLEDLLKKFPKTTYIPPVKAPLHLQITSWARIGILSYSFKDLNHVFCAPNKTWEYTGFSIPLLGNNVPGIENDIKKFASGRIVNLQNDNEDEIIKAINVIDTNYEFYSKNAYKFYKSVDLLSVINDIVNKAECLNQQKKLFNHE